MLTVKHRVFSRRGGQGSGVVGMTPRIMKEIGLTAVTLLGSCLFFWFLSRSLVSALPPWRTGVLTTTSLLWVALIALTLALVANPFVLIVLIIGVPLLVFLLSPYWVSAAAAAVLLLAGLLHARWTIRDKLGARIRYRTIPTFYTAARWLLLTLLAVAASTALPAVTERWRNEVIVIPPEIVAAALQPIADVLPVSVPGQEPQLIALVTATLNRYVNSILQTNPLLAAIVALSALFLAAHFVTPFLTWPAVAVIALFVYLARRCKLVYLVKYTTVVDHLQVSDQLETHA
ncbi:MAG: hypothetical protein HY372_00805 [Candidatus Andersenbacteria bacterium]|nr:hypothetical protein [Candidatus Andersenbacteria bacterium]